MVRLKEGVSDELPQPPNVADESNVGAIASAATQPLIAQAEAQHSEIVPDLGQILDQQHGPLPEDPNRWFETVGSMQAFTKYLESHGIIRDTGQGMTGPQSVFLYNVLEEQWRKLQEELRKMHGGDKFVIEQILRNIRESVKDSDSHRNEYRKNLREHEAGISHVRRQMKEEQYMTDPDTPGVFKGGAGRLYKHAMFGKRKAPRFGVRKAGKAVKYPKKPWFDPQQRGRDMPKLEYSELATAKSVATDVQAEYLKLQKTEPILGRLDMMNMPAVVGEDGGQYFQQLSRRTPKAARIMRDMNLLNHAVTGRLDTAESLHDIGRKLHAHRLKRNKVMQQWEANIPLDATMARERLILAMRKDNAAAKKAREGGDKAAFQLHRSKPERT